MYKCKFCGNKSNFVEHNIVATEVMVIDNELEQIKEK